VRIRSATSRTTFRASPLLEWTSRPPGRLGKRLLDEIEAYLEFFAVARPDDRES
jgi:hypothetical protein